MRINRHWTKSEDRFLRNNFLCMTCSQMALIINRTRDAVRNRMMIIRLKRPRHIWHELQLRTCFRKGHVPANKGMRGVRVSPATEFKKGHRPENTKYDGFISLRVDNRGRKQKWIRIAKMKWIPYQHYVWKKYHGRIPKGMCVSFKDGNDLNCRISNLCLITRDQLCRKNSNPKKVSKAMREHWNKGTHLKSDKYIVWTLAGRDQNLRELYSQEPKLIALQRLKLQLRRSINVATESQQDDR